MKALVLSEYNKFVYQEVPAPIPQAGEVLVRVMASAVCGSDIHGMDGSTGRRIPPLIMGHEASGIIEQLGEGVNGFSVGDRVTFDSTIYCGECEHCKNGRVNLCGNRRVLGVSCGDYKRDGTFAEYIAIPERILYRLPDNVSFVAAAMVEPLSVAYHAATRAKVSEGCTCAVVGAGTIGMLIVQVLKALGAGTVIALDIDQDKLAFASQNGADLVIDNREPDALEQIRSISKDGDGVDIAVDATGISATMNLSLNATRKGGSTILVGNIQKLTEFPLQWVVTRELSVYGSCASSGEYPACLELISSGKVQVESLISKQVPLSEGNEWTHRVKQGERGLSKIVLIP